MPAADYEFKYLLKRVQLSRTEQPNFYVITGGKPEDIERTYRNYQGFFGLAIDRNNNFLDGGLEDYRIGKVFS